MGSWITYGLGAESRDLPSFVVMSTGSGISGGAACWSSGFLPSVYSGTRFRNTGDPILNVSTPQGIEAGTQKRHHRPHQRDEPAPPQTRWRQRDRHAHRQLRDGLPPAKLRTRADGPHQARTKPRSKIYGCDPKVPSFARACLLARRMVERGVRFINIYNEGWDAHSNVEGNVKQQQQKHRSGQHRAHQRSQTARPARQHARRLGR